MKKILSAILALAMMFSLAISSVAFAAEAEEAIIPAGNSMDENDVQPYGSLNGYGAAWYSAGSDRSGEFPVDVKGVSWPTAQTTLKIESFDSNTCVRVWLYSPSGVCLYESLSYSGDYLWMSKPEVKKTFSPGSTGTYKVKWEVSTLNGSAPSSGRIMCWIY